MTEPTIGQAAPDFTLPTDGGGQVTLSQFRGQKLVIYFYPKDDTPGCTTESCDFRDNMKALETLGAQVIGISKDSVKSHDKFKAKYDLNFPLASDENSDVCERYGVWTEKSMCGKKYMGIARSTFLIDQQGKIAQIWRNVKVPGHVGEVAEAIKGLAQAA
ncbi:MAG: thioredoxin-dependent thiol peroxidase [Alphaproteobacteria bacterium]|nr:thioredoxin-dependent thiol peroxidase [Alphaproteobacteria bacterium]